MNDILIQIEAILNDKSPDSRQEKIVLLINDAPDLKGIFDDTNQPVEKIKTLCNFAHSIENNGVPTEHAEKLAAIFLDEKDALQYLIQFSKNAKGNENPVHDACLFELPVENFRAGKAWPHWQMLAKNNMANPRFRELLPFAERLSKRENGKPNHALIKEKKQEINKYNAKYKKLVRHGATLTEEQKQEVKELSQQKQKAYLELAELARGLKLEDVDIAVLQARYVAYKNSVSLSRQILVNNGLSEASISKFESLKPQNDDEAIPNLVIDGSELDYAGYYLKKLDVMRAKGAAIAACLGKISNCCQSIGGQGEDCAIHGIESPNGGFYVLCKGNSQNQSEEDEIIAQAWAWRGIDNALCLDSIETKFAQKNEQLIIDFYRLLGHQLCQKYNISRVNTGAQSGITTEVALPNYYTPKVHFIDYAGYCDSKSQSPLADKMKPYLFHYTNTNAKLKPLLAADMKKFFESIFNSENPLKQNLELQKLIGFAISEKLKNLLSDLESKAKEYSRQEEIEALININQKYIQQLNEKEINFELLTEGAYINGQNKENHTALHVAVLGNQNAVDRLVALGINIDAQDKHGNTALMLGLEHLLYKDKNTEGKEIAKKFIGLNADINIKDDDENTPFLIAVTNQDIEMIRFMLDTGRVDIDLFDADMKTAIYLAAEKGDEKIFKLLLAQNAKLDVISYKKKENILMAAIRGGNSNIVTSILKVGEVNIEHTNVDGNTAIYLAAKIGNKEIFNLLLKVGKINIEHTNAEGKTAIYLAAEKGNKKIFDFLLAENASLNVISHDKKENILMAAIRGGNFDIITNILKIDKGKMLKHLNSKNETALILMLRSLLDIIKKNQKSRKDYMVQDTIIKIAPFLLEKMELKDCEHISKNDDTAILLVVKAGQLELGKLLLNKGVNIKLLFCGIKKEDSINLPEFLRSLSNEQRLEVYTLVIQEPSIFKFAIKSPEMLCELLSFFSDDNIKQRIYQRVGEVLLHDSETFMSFISDRYLIFKMKTKECLFALPTPYKEKAYKFIVENDHWFEKVLQNTCINAEPVCFLQYFVNEYKLQAFEQIINYKSRGQNRRCKGDRVTNDKII